MSYGCGHYMYRGDPGFLGNIFRAVGHVVGGAALGLVTGGPVGGIKGAIGGAISGTASNIGSTTLQAGDDPAGDAKRMVAIHAQHRATLAAHPGGVGTPPLVGPGMDRGVSMMAPGKRHRSDYPYMDTAGHIRTHPPRMDVGNMKALRRASRRAHGFLRAVRGAVRYFTPKAHKGKAYVHFKKRRAA